jgi:hypothetical protein
VNGGWSERIAEAMMFSSFAGRLSIAGLLAAVILTGLIRADTDRVGACLEEAGGAVTGPCCFGLGEGCLLFVAAVIGMNSDGDTSYLHTPAYGTLGAAMLVAYALAPATSALGCYRAGRRVDPGGTFWGPLAGAYGGCLAGTALGFGVNLISGGKLSSVTYTGEVAIPIGILVGTVAGTVVGFNLWPRPDRESGWQRHLGPPSVALGIGRTPKLSASFPSYRF